MRKVVRRPALLVVGVLVTSAIVVAVHYGVSHQQTPVVTAAEPTPHPVDSGVPLTRIMDPPPRPPTVALLGAGEASVQIGVIHNGQWWQDGRMKDWTANGAVPWPAVAQVRGDRRLRLDIASLSVPRAITVHAFAGSLGANGEPSGDPALSVECWQQDLANVTDGCRLRPRGGDHLALDLPDLPSSGLPVRIAVNISWTVILPSAKQSRQEYSWATWVFSVTA
jgi:hypothetical protein